MIAVLRSWIGEIVMQAPHAWSLTFQSEVASIATTSSASYGATRGSVWTRETRKSTCGAVLIDSALTGGTVDVIKRVPTALL